MKSGYLPTNTIRVFMPKANGLSRMYTLMSIEDQIVYQAYANVLAEGLVAIPQVRKRYKKSVFGNLYSNSVSQFFYNGKIPIKPIPKLLSKPMKAERNILPHLTLLPVMTA